MRINKPVIAGKEATFATGKDDCFLHIESFAPMALPYLKACKGVVNAIGLGFVRFAGAGGVCSRRARLYNPKVKGSIIGTVWHFRCAYARIAKFCEQPKH